ncbi:hypothetical protein PIB30_041604 [Stylosanthes scabra]|uniref:ATP-dependent Clp protease proteolytic subunit n=1 Tax=Stylosanthes scabra TaxID=79078 RepID=A0ABU6VD98_9FABA|nr:hypothetical protein [Stylosanthes scabra]
MKLCKADMSTVCVGLAASMGAFILASGTKGKRYCMPNSRVMIHQPLGTAGGKGDGTDGRGKKPTATDDEGQLSTNKFSKKVSKMKGEKTNLKIDDIQMVIADEKYCGMAKRKKKYLRNKTENMIQTTRIVKIEYQREHCFNFQDGKTVATNDSKGRK